MSYSKIQPMKYKVTYFSAQKTVEHMLRLFLHSKGHTRVFDNQNHIIEELRSFLKINNMNVPKTLTQPNISKALSIIKYTSFPKNNGTYMFIKTKGKYRFVPLDTALVPLFKLEKIYLKESVHIISENTVVFPIDKENHQIFIATLNENLPHDTLWHFESLEKSLILMLNNKTKKQQASCKLFREFFELKKEFESKIVYVYEN